MASSSAAYPLNLKSFTQKRNLLDDVDATDVNEIQNEVLALESTLGVNPALEKYSNRRFSSVNQRLDWMRARENTPSWYLGRNDTSYFYTVQGGSVVGSRPNISPVDLSIVPMGNAGADDMHMYDGTGVQIQEAGWYYIGAQMSFTAASLAGSASRTLMVAAWTGTNSNIIQNGLSTQEPDPGARFQTLHLNAFTVYPLPKGAHVDVRVAINVGIGGQSYRYGVFNGAVFGFKIRDITSPAGTWPTGP